LGSFGPIGLGGVGAIEAQERFGASDGPLGSRGSRGRGIGPLVAAFSGIDMDVLRTGVGVDADPGARESPDEVRKVSGADACEPGGSR